MFKAQDYPFNLRELIISDDGLGPTPEEPNYPGLHYIKHVERFISLPDKYNAMMKRSHGGIFCIWEDDDEYAPWHISSHVKAIIEGNCHWSKPSKVRSDYPGHIIEEDAGGRFFASIAVGRSLWRHVGGIPDTKRADFDQQFLAKLASVGSPGDPLDFSPGRVPGYCFKWHTGHYHGQGVMAGPDDETWYDKIETLSK